MKGYSLHVFLVACAVLVMVAAIYDLKTRRIPNWLTTMGLFGGIAAHAALGSVPAASASLLGAAVVGAGPLLLWRFGLVGGGDVKIVMAIGAICHASLGMTLVFIALSLMATFGILQLAWHGHLPIRAEKKRLVIAEAAKEPMRFGPALAISALTIVLVRGGF
jgi:prepilin peptidase CpaA